MTQERTLSSTLSNKEVCDSNDYASSLSSELIARNYVYLMNSRYLQEDILLIIIRFDDFKIQTLDILVRRIHIKQLLLA